MEKLIYTCILIFSININAQEVLVKLSSDYSYNNRFASKFKMLKSQPDPLLTITYKNNSDDSIYFLSEWQNSTYIPSFDCSLALSLGGDHIRDNCHSGETFNVQITYSSFRPKVWFVYSLDTTKSESDEIINCELNAVYNCYIESKEIEIVNSSKAINFNSLEITESNIGQMKDYFIFLGPFQEKSVNYNLYAFKKLGGHYHFEIDNYLNDFVYCDSEWNEGRKTWEFQKCQLPTMMGNYRLYSGSIKSNILLLKF